MREFQSSDAGSPSAKTSHTSLKMKNASNKKLGFRKNSISTLADSSCKQLKTKKTFGRSHSAQDTLATASPETSKPKFEVMPDQRQTGGPRADHFLKETYEKLR
mmetsp:Transcript_42945/g.56816  ORF Transcript_42945/g.56816 Transcript_42945/m.56816 type:complete len:104 (-) Transcript_42945:229-540(-)